MAVKALLDQAKEGFVVKAPQEVQSQVFRHIQEQQESGVVFGLTEEDKAPDFTLTGPLGEQVNLYRELAKGPVILTFYRGSWCPFCNIQLRAYQQMLPDIVKLGGQLIAVSLQSPDNSLSHKEKEELTFQVLSDPNGRVAESYRILYELPDYLQDAYNNFGLDLTEFNQTDRWILPLTATFIIDQEGNIRRAYVNPDFMKRMEPQEIIDQLIKIQTTHER
ncbi:MULTISPECIES: peroxiredoxin-like family protein [Paenibacillus]|jgi:peroxiredoxin|uniref:thioredoxin-dependent peroxiredoxin n=1 Tax=Paenibacillus cineris TaxID=237530 RepID=A0ABQ4L8Q6_9BACL|nr:peroxiredoxin-like family protein [Paenibacillus cineris]GIO52746.1 alkyl hydroperoxide reductase [Paenibacillus cineris]